MLYMKVVGKTEDEVCVNFLASLSFFFWGGGEGDERVPVGRLSSRFCFSKLVGFWTLLKIVLKSDHISYFCVRS